ncbi:AAA family ATPase [Sphaerospermopsis aphanizomenoides]|uniref:AAA family ATPase n=1 Tax=Sphaerospermopsis aphanizomenoides TaxID=459663 RepID=UPI001F388237|nr:AAA family ATPase [Sphaerospermopsis aphanizomenoides]
MNQPILQFIVTQNYKNLSLPPPIEVAELNIVIGSNGSGKSNFISCLKFLKDCLTTIPDESRGVSSFEDAVSKIGTDRILDNSVESPAIINFSYCFSQRLSNEPLHEKFNTMLTLTLFVDRKKNKIIISQEFFFIGQDLNKLNSPPFYYYKFHDREVGKGAVSVYNLPGQNSGTHLEGLDNIPTNSLGITILP